jgi:hypothetical protein
MPFQQNRILRRSATVLLAAGILAAPAGAALATPAGTAGYHDGGLAPAGTRVTGNDGHPWAGLRSADSAAPAGTRVTGDDGHPWIGRSADSATPAGTRVTGDDGYPWIG